MVLACVDHDDSLIQQPLNGLGTADTTGAMAMDDAFAMQSASLIGSSPTVGPVAMHSVS